MGLNVSTSTGFKYQEFSQKRKKHQNQEQGKDQQNSDSKSENKIRTRDLEYNYNTSSLFNSSAQQIAIDNSLKETLKYLKAHANDKRKKYVLGELWEQFNEYNQNNMTTNTELIDFEIDEKQENIFAA